MTAARWIFWSPDCNCQTSLDNRLSTVILHKICRLLWDPLIKHKDISKKFRIWETLNISTNLDSSKITIKLVEFFWGNLHFFGERSQIFFVHKNKMERGSILFGEGLRVFFWGCGSQFFFLGRGDFFLFFLGGGPKHLGKGSTFFWKPKKVLFFKTERKNHQN